MELGATMELRGRRGSQLEVEDTPYIVVGKNPTVIHMFSPRLTVLPLQGSGTTARPRGTTVVDHGTTAATAQAGTSLN